MKGYPPAGELKKVLLKAIETLENHHVTKYLSDNSEATVFHRSDADWAGSIWAPRAVKAGFKSWAVIKPATPLGGMQLENYIEVYRRLGVDAKSFSSAAEALLWLEKV
jgi:hypothetical protein